MLMLLQYVIKPFSVVFYMHYLASGWKKTLPSELAIGVPSNAEIATEMKKVSGFRTNG